MNLTEKINKLGNSICPICGTAICLKNSCKSDYHKYYLELQINNSINMTTAEKQHIEKIKKNPIKRLTAPSPDFFIKVQKWLFFGGFTCTALSSYFLSVNPESKLAVALTSISGFITVFGTILAKLPVDENKVVEKLSK